MDSEYREWILEKLPHDISAEIVQKSFNIGGYVSGLQFWSYEDRGPAKAVFTASDEDELKRWLYDKVSRNIAYNVELYNRKNEEKRWRYVRKGVEEGHWMYRENTDYDYNAIHDTRKYWMEYHLFLLKRVLTEEEIGRRVADYEASLNLWFTDKHWSFDKEQWKFMEISASKEYDTDGVEEPGKETII